MHSILDCTILLFSQSENNKILELIKPEVLLIVQFLMLCIKNSRNKKCVTFLICTILLIR
jgi:hypothetical protein